MRGGARIGLALQALGLALGLLWARPAAAGDLPGPLTETPGDAARGLALIRDAGRASCLICHAVSSLPDRDQGGIGPPLDGIAALRSAPELRQRIMDGRVLNADTLMPPYYSNEGLYRIGARWASGTIYAAQDVEDVLAFLMTLEG